MELNGYFFRGLLRKTRRRFALSAGEQALYQELIDICNEESWQTSFQVSNAELTGALMCNEKTLGTWRQALVNSGLIKYTSGKSKRAYGFYEMVVEFENRTIVKITTNASTNTTTNTSTNKGSNPSDYNKLKEIELIENTSIPIGLLVSVEPDSESSNYLSIEKTKFCIGEYIKSSKPLACEPYADYWNLCAGEIGLSPIKKINPTRKKKLRQRVKEAEFDLPEILQKASESQYIQTGKWFGFDWVIKDEVNYLKVLEGNYDTAKFEQKLMPTPRSSSEAKAKRILEEINS